MKEISGRAAESAENYRKMGKKFESGGTIEQLVEDFNSDKDKNNDIKHVKEDGEGGWEVQFENGSVIPFKDRDAVALHIERMADPAFNQAYLLGQLKLDNDLKIAAAEAAADAQTDMLPFMKDWQNNTYKATDRAFGKIKEGLVDFGEPGASSVSSAVNSIVNEVGATSRYKFINAEVTDRTIRYAKSMLEMNPEVLRKNAEKTLERMEDNNANFPPEEFPNGKPDEDDPQYKEVIKNLVFKDRDEQIENLRIRVLKDYFAMGEDGPHNRENAGSKGDGTEGNKTTDAGLKRTGTEETGMKPRDNRAEMVVDNSGSASNKTDAPTPKDPMGVAEYTVRIMSHMGQQGSAFAEKPPETGVEPRLNQKQKRKIKATAEHSLATSYKGLNDDQKVSWLNQYGKWLSKPKLNAAKRALPQSLRKKIRT
jgi:hypothetical protein